MLFWLSVNPSNQEYKAPSLSNPRILSPRQNFLGRKHKFFGCPQQASLLPSGCYTLKPYHNPPFPIPNPTPPIPYSHLSAIPLMIPLNSMSLDLPIKNDKQWRSNTVARSFQSLLASSRWEENKTLSLFNKPIRWLASGNIPLTSEGERLGY